MDGLNFFTFVLGYDDVRKGIAYKREGGAHHLSLGCRLKFLVSLKVLRTESHCFSPSGRVMCKQMLSMISSRCQIKPEPRSYCPLGGYFFSDEHPIHFYIGLPHGGGRYI